MPEALLFKFSPSTRGAGCAMMPVGNIEKRDVTKRVNKAYRIRHAPDCMLYAVVSDEVEDSVSHRRLHHHSVNLAAGPVGQKHWAGLGTQDEHVMSAIILFITTGPFVFTNQILRIFINRTTCDHANLFVLTHN